MSKLNLIHLTKDEITKEEAQKARGGTTGCVCPCVCRCICSGEIRILTFQEDAAFLKVENKTPVLE